MYTESGRKVANKELSGRDSLPFSILSNSYRNMEDRPRLLVIEEMLKAADHIPNDQLTFSEIDRRLSKVEMSAEERSLIPQIIEELRTAASQGATELRPERPFRNIFSNVSDRYEKELLSIYHNPEHDFDTRRLNVLYLIDKIEDEEQDSCAFVERRKSTWPSIIKVKLRQLISSDPKLANQPEIMEIADEVVDELHKRLLKSIGGV